jgi:hypothetical protein
MRHEMTTPMKIIHNSISEVESNIEGVFLVPYFHTGEDYNMSDSYLSQAYRRTVIEKAIHKIFYDGTIKNTNDFISFFKQEDIELFFVYYKGEEAGFLWLSPFVQKSAFITYCLYKNFLRESLVISQACINGIFSRKNKDDEAIFDTLLGLTPASNKLALKFLRKNGMEVVGKIPGLIFDNAKNKSIDGIISYLSRSQKKKNIFPPNFW